MCNMKPYTCPECLEVHSQGAMTRHVCPAYECNHKTSNEQASNASSRSNFGSNSKLSEGNFSDSGSKNRDQEKPSSTVVEDQNDNEERSDSSPNGSRHRGINLRDNSRVEVQTTASPGDNKVRRWQCKQKAESRSHDRDEPSQESKQPYR